MIDDKERQIKHKTVHVQSLTEENVRLVEELKQLKDNIEKSKHRLITMESENNSLLQDKLNLHKAVDELDALKAKYKKVEDASRAEIERIHDFY